MTSKTLRTCQHPGDMTAFSCPYLGTNIQSCQKEIYTICFRFRVQSNHNDVKYSKLVNHPYMRTLDNANARLPCANEQTYFCLFQGAVGDKHLR